MKKILYSILIGQGLWCSSCVMLHKNYQSEQHAQRTKTDIPIFTQEPELRTYEEVSHYEAVGSNITSFDRVLARIKNQAKRDGCEALVRVKFYRQPIGSGVKPTSFPTIEAVGIRFVERNKLANN